jgi:hypothetical protein
MSRGFLFNLIRLYINNCNCRKGNNPPILVVCLGDRAFSHFFRLTTTRDLLAEPPIKNNRGLTGYLSPIFLYIIGNFNAREKGVFFPEFPKTPAKLPQSIKFSTIIRLSISDK